MKPTKTIFIILSVLIIIAVIVVAVLRPGKNNTHNPAGEPVVTTGTAEATSFAWRFPNGGEDLDGLPKTQVSLDVTYANGIVVSKRIEEVQGSCNNVDPQKEDADRVVGTTKIQCYAAGFGEYYKIIKGINSYEVRRKHIEEGVPEVAPTEFNYETVAEFPLMQ